VARLPERVREHHAGAVLAQHAHPGAEGLHTQARQVDVLADRRVGRVEHLEATVHQEPVDLVGRDAPSDPRACFEHLHLHPGRFQHRRTHQAGHPGAHDDHLGVP
jgi:hypothetical protein